MGAGQTRNFKESIDSGLPAAWDGSTKRPGTTSRNDSIGAAKPANPAGPNRNSPTPWLNVHQGQTCSRFRKRFEKASALPGSAPAFAGGARCNCPPSAR
jgi:hypothetical protein